MKGISLTGAIVITADQQRSRDSGDAVPTALDALCLLNGFDLAWERTVGDEIQALTTKPAAVVDAIRQLARLGNWQVGVGIGFVELPLPPSTRVARGTAYLAAREAVDAAKKAPTAAAVRGCARQDAEAALWLLLSVLERRTPEGWEVADLLETGLPQSAVAAGLGISQSAVSQRVARAGVEVSVAGARLLTSLLTRELKELTDPLARLES